MGFRFDSADRKGKKGAPRKASGFGMLMIFVVLGVSIVLGWWSVNIPLRTYVPIPDRWYAPILPNVPGVSVRPIQLAIGVISFILLQFIVVLISGILFPLPPEEKYDKDGLYIGKRKQ